MNELSTSGNLTQCKRDDSLLC